MLVRASSRCSARAVARLPQLLIVLAPARRDCRGVRGHRARSSSSGARSRARASTASSRRSASARATSRSSPSSCGGGRPSPRHPGSRRAFDPDARAQASRAGRPRLVHVGRARQPRARSSRRACTARVCSSSENGRTIVLPNPIRVDTTAPRDHARARLPACLLARRRRATRPGHGVVRDRRARSRDDARRRPATRARASSGSLEGRLVWFGRVNGRVVRPGTLRDPACAPSTAPGTARSRTRAVPVRVRYVELSRERIEVGAGKRFSVRVRTDARRIAGSSQARGARDDARFWSCAHPRSRAATRSSSPWAAVRRAPRSSSSSRGMTPPLIVLGVSRSGTTLLRVILDRSPGIAIPDESFFVPLLARRHGKTVEAARFLDDLSRISDDPRLGSLASADVAPRSASGHADGRGDRGDLRGVRRRRRQAALGRQDADVHAPPPAPRRALPRRAVRPPDPRRARRGALVPADAGGHVHADVGASDDAGASSPACGGRRSPTRARSGRRVGAARYLEVRYEELVADPEATVRAICAFADIPFEPAMLDYAGAVDVSAKPHQQRLLTPPTHGRPELARRHGRTGRRRRSRRSRAISSSELGYERALGGRRRARGRLSRAPGTTPGSQPGTRRPSLVQRSPLWRRRHPRALSLTCARSVATAASR